MSEKWKKICSVILVIAMLCSVLNLSVGTDPNVESVYAATAGVGDVEVFYDVDNSITNMYNVAVTYYDYLSDNELMNGWKVVSNYGNYDDGWTQYTSFNTALANYYLSSGLTTTGLYFGNLLSSNKNGFWLAYQVASEIDTLTAIYANYDYQANNSNYLDGYSYSAQGLVYNQLDTDGNLQIADGVVAPWFSKNFLLNTNYSSSSYFGGTLGKVLSSRFPLRAEQQVILLMVILFTQQQMVYLP